MSMRPPIVATCIRGNDDGGYFVKDLRAGDATLGMHYDLIIVRRGALDELGVARNAVEEWLDLQLRLRLNPGGRWIEVDDSGNSV